MRALTSDDILMGREKKSPLTEEMELNLERLLFALNKLQQLWKLQFRVTSGYRPPVINTAIGGAKNSAHTMCMAADIYDPDNKLANWLVREPKWLEQLGLYMEDPSYTPTWCHLQIRPTRNRIFIPYPRKV